jgi:hypothetical protein
MRAFAVLLAAASLSGCYEYLAPPAGGSLAGRRVNVTLTDMGSAILAPQIGPANEAIGGMLLADSGSALLVSVLSVRNRNGLEQGWRGERVRVPVQFVDRLEERSLSKRRTVLASVMLAALVVGAERVLNGPGGSNVGGPGPGGPPGGK